MKRISLITTLLLTVILSSAAQGFYVYTKKQSNPKLIYHNSIDSVYFTFDEGSVKQHFATSDADIAFDINDIDSIRFRHESYLEALMTDLVLPKENCEIRIPGTFHISNYWYGTPQEMSLSFSENDTDYGTRKLYRVATEVFDYEKREVAEYSDSIYITRLDEPLLLDEKPFKSEFCRYLCVLPSQKSEYRLKFNPRINPRLKLETTEEWAETYWDNDSTLVIALDENTGSQRQCSLKISQNSVYFNIEDSYRDGYGAYDIIQLKAGTHSAEEHRKALRDLYDQCDGPNWAYATDWWSEKPIWEWECINHFEWGSEEFRIDRVLTLNIGGRQFTGLKGELPESFAIIMDDATLLNLSGGALTKFPYNIRHHKRWQEFGWNFIRQNIIYGGIVDFSDINLKVPDEKIFDYTNVKETTIKDVLAEHKVTWVLDAALSENAENATYFVEPLFVDTYLSYAPKDLGFVLSRGIYDPLNDDPTYRKRIEQAKGVGLPETLRYTHNFGEASGRSFGSMSLVNDKGDLLWHVERDWDIPAEWYVSQIEPILREQLGEPVDHDPYVPKIYTSTDYSRDGEVLTLQKSTVGKGIDIVLMGDGYVDNTMGKDGFYEQQMKESMEHIFAVEPMKSMRDRFNVYAVKVVSPNSCYTPNAKLRLNRDFNNVAEYLAKLNVDPERTHTCLIENRPDQFLSGYADMFDNGGSFSVIDKGGPSAIIRHELVGHGIAKLLDEYIAGNNIVDENEIDEFKKSFEAFYHLKGWGLNLSTTDDPKLVPWAHLLADEQYRDQVGIFKGAWYWPENLWRATEDNIMNQNHDFFNAPTREILYKVIMKESEGESWSYDFNTFKAWDLKIQSSGEANKGALFDSYTHNKPIEVKSGPVQRIVKIGDRYEIIPLTVPLQE